MSVAGMYMLNTSRYDEEKVEQALEMLYVDRRNEFRTLSEELLSKKALEAMPNWREFVLNFSLDVEEAFRTWTGDSPLVQSSPQKALTLLRQLGHDKTSMNELAHLLNLSFNISLEFKEIYRRLR
ncbi:MAG: hypothetical protein J4F28_07315 [Nitrosopumilaceae archaeon]|nr:hypothetical protein [Nitrosopumilaceae archaeon]